MKQIITITMLFAACLAIASNTAKTSLRSSNYEPVNADVTNKQMRSSMLAECPELYYDGFESGLGTWIDGGSNCARSNSFPNTGTWSVELRAGVGLTSSMYTPALNLSGVGVTLSFSFYPQGYETGEGLVLEYATDANGTFTGFTAWVRGNHFQNDTLYNITVPMNSVNWTSTSRLRLRSVASATDDRVYIDDVVITDCCEVGAACNDGSQCTTGDVIQANCQCAGTWQDADGDGTCDAFDICPGLDDYLVISQEPCDDGDPCTVGDHLDDDVCACQGQYIDWDQDGYCQAEDPNDLDGCNPDPNHFACNPCTTLDNGHFESDFNAWNSGGNDCNRLYAPQYASAGNYCVRLQDNSGGNSSMFTDIFNLAGEQFVSISFSFITVSMEANEDFFLEVSTNGGGSYTIVKEWNSGVEFQNNTRYFESVDITGITWTSQSRLRLRCDASANDDRVYIDEVLIRSCDNHFLAQELQPVENVSLEDPTIDAGLDAKVILSPNPVSTELRIEGVQLDNANISIINTSGGLVTVIPLMSQTVDVAELIPGLYFLRIEKDGQVVIKRFVKD